MPEPKMNILLLRRDLRISDNPILHHLAATNHDFTHLVPVYVFPPHQMEVSGFIKDGSPSPFPEARSSVGNYWRCGPHRAKFIAQSVWELQMSLRSIDSGLVLRVGKPADILHNLIEGLQESGQTVGAVWMTGEEGVEEKRDERDVSDVCGKHGVDFKLWGDEKYYVDDRDLTIDKPSDLPDIFTTYRKSAEPLRDRPRAVLPTPKKGELPPMPPASVIPSQPSPFSIPDTLDQLEESVTKPVQNYISKMSALPEGAVSAHPFAGGEAAAQKRLQHLIVSGCMSKYKETRNGLVGTEYSTKLSAYLALGCLTARQIHQAMVGYEDGTNQAYDQVEGYGAGENEGTKAVRFELLWRDYMRLCARKFGHKLFRVSGFKCNEAAYTGTDEDKQPKWKTANKDTALPQQDPGPDGVATMLKRFEAGNTGMGLIDAAQRELIHTGYTSNRARQNVASFLAKHLGIDWRYGAEWYEMLLIDYDVASNWANWQYVAGVGNDPRGAARIFNPVKQAFDYDKTGNYVRSWVPEVRKLGKLENVFQVWTASEEDLKEAGLEGNVMVTDPVKRIEFMVEGKPKARRVYPRRRIPRPGEPGAERVYDVSRDPSTVTLSISPTLRPHRGGWSNYSPVEPYRPRDPRLSSRGGGYAGGRGGGGGRGGPRGGGYGGGGHTEPPGSYGRGGGVYGYVRGVATGNYYRGQHPGTRGSGRGGQWNAWPMQSSNV